MTLQSIVTSIDIDGGFWAVVIFVLLTLIQITPIKLNPWNAIFKWLGTKLNGTLCQDIKEIKDELSDVKNQQEFDRAMTSRYRVIHAADDILNGANPSDEHIEQLGEDIEIYKEYCDKHPGYKNHKGKKSMKIILDYEKKIAEEQISQSIEKDDANE